MNDQQNDDKPGVDAARRRDVMNFRRTNYSPGEVVEGGKCIFSGVPCIREMCEQFDPLGDQCGIRSMGMAASFFLEFYGPQIRGDEDDEPTEPVPPTADQVEPDPGEGSEAGGGNAENVGQVGEGRDETTGHQERGHSEEDE